MSNESYTADEAQRLGDWAIEFYRSKERKNWSSQRTENSEEDLRTIIPGGIRKLQVHGKTIIADLLEKDK